MHRYYGTITIFDGRGRNLIFVYVYMPSLDLHKLFTFKSSLKPLSY